MSTADFQVPCRVVPGSVIRGLCIDCHEELVGEVALLLVCIGGKVGIQVGIASDQHMHALARVPLDVIPFVKD